MNKNFTHLHLHTEYSLLDGVGKIDEYLDRAKEIGMSSMAITDHGNMFGAIEFYKKAIKKGIKPIIGIEVYIGDVKNEEEEKDETLDRKNFHLILLAKNEEGYKNIMKITSYSYIEGFYYKPRVSKEFLKNNSKGVIALSACMQGEISSLILEGASDEKIDEAIKEYVEIFQDRFYIEIQGNGVNGQKELNIELIRVANRNSLKVVATNDTHYVNYGDAPLQELLICIQTGVKLSDEKRMKIDTEELYLKNREQMYESLKFTEEDIEKWILRYSKTKEINILNFMEKLNSKIIDYLDETNEIAQKCGFNIEFGKFKFPNYKIPDNFKSIEEYLKYLVFKGLNERFKNTVEQEYIDRAKYELSVINKMGYAAYFVVVWDFIYKAKEKEIAIGPGRGSAAGSLVAYSLGITDLDPIEYKLIFERFLNPERISMPDIDIDICAVRRQEVIEYVIEKYGSDHVAQIITFGRMKARAAVRDIGRVMDIPLFKIDKLAKLLPADLILEKSINLIPEVKELYISDFEIQKVLDFAKKLENTVRHASIHAAGVVITGEPLTENLPLYSDSKGKSISTQYQMKEVEELGILKMDFLGLGNLTILQRAQNFVKKNKEISIKLSEIPLNDTNTYEMITHGDTTGVFQLESRGIRNLIRKLKPDRFADIIALLALYRPGPLGSGMVDSFINCKNGLEEIKYPDPSLEEILHETYGVILYQEQVMKIANKMADYTLGESDNLRRAMGKKDFALMETNRNKFIERAIEKGYLQEKALEIFELIDKFAGYGFNKSHSAAYALIAYWTAYFKANYPLEYYTAILSSMSHIDNIAFYIEDAKYHKIKILPPDINSSLEGFRMEEDKIRFSVSGVKNIGEGFVEKLIEERESNGEYKTYEDFVIRMRKKGLNKKVLQSLIYSGALDSVYGNRKQKIESIDKVLDYAERFLKEDDVQQMNLFGAAKGVLNRFTFPPIEEYEMSEILEYEKEIMGFYFSAHPLDQFKNVIEVLKIGSIAEISEEKNVHHIKTYGIIKDIKKIITKKDGKIMANFILEDYYDAIQGIIFPKEYEVQFDLLKIGNPVIVIGNIQVDYFNDQETLKVITKEIIPMKELGNYYKGHCDILLDKDEDRNKFNKLKKIITSHPGKMKLNYWNYQDRSAPVVSKLKISPSKLFIDEVSELLGTEKIIVKL